MCSNVNLYPRIIELCKLSGDTMYSLSKRSGVSESVLSRLKTNSQTKISRKNLILLANYFCVNENWLATGEGDRDAPGLVKDTTIHDSALHSRFVQIAQKLYGDDDQSDFNKVISVDLETMSIFTDIPQHRLWKIIYDSQFPTYSEIISLLKSDRNLDANWLLLGVGDMKKSNSHNERS